MESMFIWIVLFSAAAVLLLGAFLVASEKELKKKRSEINDLLGRLEDASTASTIAPSAEAAANGAEVTGLRAKNQELQKDIAALQDDLDAAHRAIDELRAAKPAADNDATLAELQQMRGANTQLLAQVEDLRGQLQASEAKLNSASTTDSGAYERQTQLENSLIELKHQLEKSQTRNRELESSATPMVDLRAVEAKHREETQTLQARIAELEKSLSASAESAHQIDGLQQRIRESEKLEQELRATLRQREEELRQWQERLAARDEIKKRMLALQPVFDQLVAKQSSLIEQQRAYHGELKSFAQFLSASHDGTIAPLAYPDPHTDQEGAMPAPSQLTPAAAASIRSEMTGTPEAENRGQASGDAEIAPKGNRAFGVFHAVIAVVIGGALTALFWSQSGDQPVTHAAKPSPVAVPAQKTAAASIPQQAAPSAETVASAAVVNNNADAPLEQIEPVRKAKAQPAARAVAGTYEVTRGTRVFAAPTELSQQVGEIEPGLKVNVVNARDGWLEIHSKHGRPPGFIRSDAAARAGR
jgi:hypothetical protein